MRRFIRKIARLPLLLFHGIYYVPAFIFVILIRFFRPWMHVRFGKLVSHRIGHFWALEIYLSEREAGLLPSGTLDLFYSLDDAYVCNKPLSEKWQGKAHYFPRSKLLYTIDCFSRRIPGAEAHVIKIESLPSNERYQLENFTAKHSFSYFAHPPSVSVLLQKTQGHIKFTTEEEQNGKKKMAEMGVPSDAEIVCIHARSPAYLNRIFPDMKWAHHDHRDWAIETCLPAAASLAEEGISVLRFGLTDEKLPETWLGNRVIDYGAIYHSPLMDLYVASRARFFVIAQSGAYIFPLLFRKPLLVLNIVEFGYLTPAYSGHDLFLPKKFFSKVELRYWSFAEILRFGSENVTPEGLEKAGIELHDNTVDEIKEAVAEIHARVGGSWTDEKKDVELQGRFWDVFRNHGVLRPAKLRIGAAYLRQSERYL
jgi:putative glycosyltransferase (TIGR04372 family)